MMCCNYIQYSFDRKPKCDRLRQTQDRILMGIQSTWGVWMQGSAEKVVWHFGRLWLPACLERYACRRRGVQGTISRLQPRRRSG